VWSAGGFASHVAHILCRDVLSVRELDRQATRIALRIADLPPGWCAGRIPVGAETLDLMGWRDGDRTRHDVRAPGGSRVQVEATETSQPEPVTP
jgi:hypothetical protein